MVPTYNHWHPPTYLPTLSLTQTAKSGRDALMVAKSTCSEDWNYKTFLAVTDNAVYYHALKLDTLSIIYLILFLGNLVANLLNAL